MLERRPVFPNVIEINHQLQRVLGCNVYLIYVEDEWVLIDTGYDEVVDELLELIRQLDFPFANCKLLIATHADVDHIQGLAKAKEMLRTVRSGFSLMAEMSDRCPNTSQRGDVH